MTDPRPSETPDERADRNFGELLQELRVAQTGVQILFAFLLLLPFQGAFAELSAGLKRVYAVSLLSALVAAALMIAPVPLHRLLFRQHRKEEIIQWAHRLSTLGLAFLALSMTGGVLLAVDVSLGSPFSWIASALAGLLFVGLWFALPTRLRSKAS